MELAYASKKRIIVKLPNKGNISDCSNRNRITLFLLSTPGKVLTRVLLNRLQDAVDQKLSR